MKKHSILIGILLILATCLIAALTSCITINYCPCEEEPEIRYWGPIDDGFPKYEIVPWQWEQDWNDTLNDRLFPLDNTFPLPYQFYSVPCDTIILMP